MDIDKVELDDFERQIEDELERGEWVEAEDSEKIKEELKEGAKAHLNARKMTLEAIEKLSGTPLRELRRRIEKIVKPVRMLVFGSYARGDFHEESDVDVLIVVPDDIKDREDLESRITKEVIEFNLEHGTFVSSIVLRESEARLLPVGRKALKEGVEIERER